MKSVLMVAYQYPPEGSSSGVLRTLKFSKYLIEYGWQPHILTLRESLYAVRDEALLRDVPPAVTVHRTFALDSGRHLAFKGRYLAALAVPDRFISWLPFGVARGLRVVRKAGIRVLHSTSPPPTAHLIAAAIKRWTGLPWAADFRDPWIEEGLHPRPGSVRYRVESALERYVIHNADRIIVTTPDFKNELLLRFRSLGAEKVKVIYNGYDEEDFRNIGDGSAGGKFDIIHAGLLNPEFRDPFPLLQTISEMLCDDSLPRDQVQITLLGGSSYVHSPAFCSRLEQLGLHGVVEVASRIPHRMALQRLMRGSVLLLLQASEDTRSLVPAKAFEYLRLGRPILALTMEGATASVLKGMEQCHVLNPFDREGLRKALLDLYRLWRSRPEGIHISRPILQYERSHLTRVLADVLERIAP